MKNDWRAQAIVVIVSAFAVAGCSSTQPDQSGTRTASLSFGAVGLVDLWDCYELPFASCFPALENPPSTLQLKENRKVPWKYSLKITVIRAGTSDEVVVTSLSGEVGSSVEPHPPDQDPIENFVSLTDYDPAMPPAPDKVVGGITYSNGHRVSTGNPLYLATIPVDPSNPNPPNILLNTTQSFDFIMDAGDTVIVRARKEGVDTAPAFQPPLANVKLEAFLLISGEPVVAQGDQISATDNQAGMTFSYTMR